MAADAEGERTRLAEALAAIAAGQADTLLVAALGAVADSLAQLLRLLEWLEAADASLLALDVGFDSADGSVRDATALLREIDRWGREPGPHKRPRGRPGLGHAHPELAERIAGLREDGASLQAIAERLNREGVPTPRGGREWRASSVQSALGYKRPRPPAPGAPPPGNGPEPRPGRKPGPEHRPGGKHDPEHRPGGKHDPEHRPGGKHDPEHRPGGKHDPEHRPRGKHDPEHRPGGKHDPEHPPGGKHGPKGKRGERP